MTVKELRILGLSDTERQLLLDAINSHIYWQLSEPDNRNDGAVVDDTPDMAVYRALEARLHLTKG
jgi:hypothetical protein